MTSIDENSLQQAIARAVDMTAKRDYAGALPIFSAVYQAVPPEKFPQGMSAYGLCLSKVEHKNKLGAELCEKAIKIQGYETGHHANIVRLYVGVNNRRRAVEILDAALKRQPKDVKLLKVREEIGWRKAPYLHFLPRQHPLNKAYSRALGGMSKNARVIGYVLFSVFGIALIYFVFKMVVQ